MSARVLVAHDNETIRRVIEVLLQSAGFDVHCVADGNACREALSQSPAAMVLDVAISDVMAFDLIDAARKLVPTVPVVLVASIYNRTSYKRSPTSLYGANDYVEQHHIVDALVQKVSALLGKSIAAPATREMAESVRLAGEGAMQNPMQPTSAAPGVDPVVRAQRLARLIVSDIALYNGDALRAASSRGADELNARLRVDLEEGRLLFDMRVSTSVRTGRDFIGEALAELVSSSREER